LTGAATWAESTLERDSLRQHSNRWASAQATYGITSFLAAYARYVYIKYRFDEGIVIDARFPQRFDRQGIHVGITTSIPIIR
jgi:hypothetical protein